jgi:hypothetical protein
MLIFNFKFILNWLPLLRRKEPYREANFEIINKKIERITPLVIAIVGRIKNPIPIMADFKKIKAVI